MTWLFLVSTLAMAGSGKKQLVGDHSAQSLRLGEIQLGTSGIAMGLLPRVQVSTRATLDAVGLPNGEAKVQLLDRPNLDVAIDGSYLTSSLVGLEAQAWGAGANASMHYRRLSFHTGLHHFAYTMSGLPTESPAWIVSIAGQDPLAELDSEYTDFVDVGFGWQATTLRGGVELRVLGRSGLLLQGSIALGGRLDIRAATTIEDTTVDVGHALPGIQMLKGSTKPWGSWVGSVSWQQVLGPIHLRAGIGVSAVPYAWVTQAMSASMRIGGWRLKRSHPAGVLAKDEPKNADALATTAVVGEDWILLPGDLEPLPVYPEPPVYVPPPPLPGEADDAGDAIVEALPETEDVSVADDEPLPQ